MKAVCTPPMAVFGASVAGSGSPNPNVEYGELESDWEIPASGRSKASKQSVLLMILTVIEGEDGV